MKSCLLSLITMLSFQTTSLFAQEMPSGLIINDNPPPSVIVDRDINKHGVLIIDDGFDISNPAFQDKIVGTYTIDCSKQPDLFALAHFLHQNKLPLEQAKASLLNFLKIPDEGCTISKDIKFEKSDKFEKYESLKDDFNMIIKSKGRILPKTITEKIFQDIANVLTGEQKYSYHGTMVASTISYKNDDVQLVFVQRSLGGSAIKHEKTEMEKAIEQMCNSLEAYHLYSNLLEDKEIQKAYVERPLTSEEKILEELSKKHQVQFVNYSFGQSSRIVRGKALENLNCSYSPNMKKIYSILGGLEQRRRNFLRTETEYLKEADVLIFQAAGNDAQKIDSHEDSLTCSDQSSNYLVIGATDWKNELASRVTNHGDCVDLYTLGQQVVVSAPNGFLVPVDGTSFSSPLAIRHVTTTFDTGMTSKEIKKALLESVESDKILGEDTYPNELAFENKDLLIF